MSHPTPDLQRLDWALAELSGTQTPPDLTRAVLARLRAGDVPELPDGPPAAPTTRLRWLPAAALLFAAALLAVWAAARPAPAALGTPPQEPVVVFSRAEVDALPATTRAVLAHGLGDADVAALTRLRDLRWLELRYPDAMPLGLGLKTVPPERHACITAQCFVTLSQMPTLQTLRLRGAYAITEAMPLGGTGGGPEAIATDTLGRLAALPHLTDLALSHFDTPAYVLRELPSLRSLRRLDLTANYGADAEAIAAIVQCKNLEELVLRACMTLPGDAIARLHELPELRHLDVSDIDGFNWRSSPLPVGPTARAWLAAARNAAGAGRGVTDAALEGLARAAKLRVLKLAQANCTLRGFAALRSCEALEVLDLSGVSPAPQQLDELADLLPPLLELAVCGNFSDALCRKLRASQPRLRRLELPACYAVTDAGLDELLGIATLSHLDVRQCRGLTPACLPSLRRARGLLFLDLRHIDWVTAEHLGDLRAALPGLQTLLANVPGHDREPPPRAGR